MQAYWSGEMVAQRIGKAWTERLAPAGKAMNGHTEMGTEKAGKMGDGEEKK